MNENICQLEENQRIPKEIIRDWLRISEESFFAFYDRIPNVG